ncbi:MAG TPA: hypothetical protein VMS76_09320 [Planctomycetota bacterium]|nr:hypothetical protein [Planctomycetota bacterium]
MIRNTPAIPRAARTREPSRPRRGRGGGARGARAGDDARPRTGPARGRGAQGQAHLACLPGSGADAAASALAALGDIEEPEDTPALRWTLFHGTGDREQLAAAKRLLDDSLVRVPAEHNDTMCRNLLVHREILAAASQEAGL